MSKNYLNCLVLLTVALLWGGSFVAIKYDILSWPPFFSAALRMLVSLLTVFVVSLAFQKSIKIPFSLRWRVWIVGIFALGIPFASLFWGERFVSPGLAGIINSTTLIWSFLFGLILFDQEPSRRVIKIAGIVIGFLGILIIFWPMLSFSESKMQLIGAASVMLMALSYAIASVLNQLFFSKYGKVELNANLFHQCLSALIFTLTLSLLFEKWPSWQLFSTSTNAIFGVLYLGIFSTALGWFLYYHLIREWGAVKANVTAYLVPITALFDDYLFFHRIPQLSEIIGVFIILFAIFLISSTKKTVLQCRN